MPGDGVKDFVAPARIKTRLKIAGLAHGHPTVKLMLLGQIANAPTRFGRQRRGIETENVGVAACGLQQTEQHSDCGSFARTIAAEKCKHASLRHFEIEFVNSAFPTKIACETTSPNDWLITHLFASAGCFH